MNSKPFSANTYKERRKKLMQAVGSGKILLLGNKDVGMNFEHNIYSFRQDSSFLYYIGINLPDMVAVLDCDSGETTIYGDDAGIEMIVWTGPQPSMEEQASSCGIEHIKPLTAALQQEGDYMTLPSYRAEHTVFYHEHFGQNHQPSLALMKAIIAQREVKSDEEISLLHEAATHTRNMHETVLKAARPGMFEYELVGLAATYAYENDVKWSFPPILTKDGQTLHNHHHHNKIQDGDLVLFDGGCEVSAGYCGDMTRTFPAGKQYSPLQREVYNTVEQALLHAEKICKAGDYYKDVHLEAAKVITDGLKSIGWMKGNTEDAVAAGAHTLFFQHGLGHQMGLDVHDMENFGEQYVGYDDSLQKSTEFGLKSLRLGKKLQKGFVITIEPGIYVIPQLVAMRKTEGAYMDFIDYAAVEKNIDAGGIRIENDYVITEQGAELLGEPLTTSSVEIENLRK